MYHGHKAPVVTPVVTPVVAPADALKTQATRWNAAQQQMRPANSDFVNQNRQSAVTNFNQKNPFVGSLDMHVKNGTLIDN